MNKCKICGKFFDVLHTCKNNSSDDDNGFVIGLATGIATSASGIIGAELHNSILNNSSSFDNSSSNCDTGSSSDNSCGVNY